MILGVEHQEPATTSAYQFAPDCPVPAPELVPFVDLRVAHTRRAAALVPPVLVHQLAEEGRVALLQRLPAAPRQLLDEVQILEHVGVVLLGSLLLIGEDAAGAAGESCEK